MRKIILVLVSCILLTGNLYAKQNSNEQVVEDYLKKAMLLMSEKKSDSDEGEALLYAEKARKWMLNNNMDMKGILASTVFITTGMAYCNLNGGKSSTYNEMGKTYVVEAYKIRKNLLGEEHKMTKDVYTIFNSLPK